VFSEEIVIKIAPHASVLASSLRVVARRILKWIVPPTIESYFSSRRFVSTSVFGKSVYTCVDGGLLS